MEKVLQPETPTAFAPGATVVYRVTAACNNLIGGCGTLNISDVLPPELEARSCNAPPAVTCTLTGGGTGYTITKNPYNGGDTLAITLTTRVRLGQDPAVNIVNTADATAGNVDNPDISASAPPISVNAGTPNWEVRKQRVDPTGVNPAPGAPVTYRVQLCSLSGVGNVDLDGAVIVDTLPAGTTVVNAGGGTVAAGPPTTVTWDLGAISLADLYGGNAANTTQCIDRFLTIDVPSAPTYDIGDTLLNVANATITPQGGVGIGIGPATVSDTLIGPVGNANPSKFGNDVAPSAGFTDINWRPTFDTSGSNVALTDFSFVDVLPPNAPGTAGPFDIVSIRSGTWPAGDPLLGYQIVADLQTAEAPCSASSGTYVTVTGGTGIVNGANTLFNAGTAFPATHRCVRWAFRNVGSGPANEVPRAFGFSTRPQIIQSVPAGEDEGTVTNCSFVRLTAGAGPAQTQGPSCATVNIEPPTPAIQVDKTRVGSGQIQPTSELVFRLSFHHTDNDSTAAIVDPTVADLLPANLEFLGWEAYSYSGPAANQPYLTVTENYGGSGRTLVRFTWGAVPAGAVDFNGNPAGAANPASFAHTIANNQMPDMDIRVRVLPGTPASNYSNQLAVFHSGGGFSCAGNGTVAATDVDDLNANGDDAESLCRNSLGYTVIDAAVLLGEKWIRGDVGLPNVDDPSDLVDPPGGICPDYGSTYAGTPDQYTRFPCVAQTDHGGNFVYRARIENAGNLNLDDYVLYDLLPFVGDTGSGGPLSNTARESRFRPVLTGPVVVESNGSANSNPTVEYTTTVNPCRPEVGYNAGCTVATFVLAGGVADFSLVTAFRISDFNSAGDFAPLEVITYEVPMQAPVSGAPPSIVGNPAIFNPSWNSFAHRAREASAGNNGPLLQVAEPPKVGIILPERYRLGNLVWNDFNNNGIAEIGEPGIDGVSVSLCRDDDGTPGASAGDSLIATTVTATLAGEAGKYAFDTLLGGSDYYLAIADGQPALAGFLSSTNGEEGSPNGDGDNNDNGINPSGASCVGPALRSGSITLGPVGATEPTNEVLRAGSAIDDDDDGSDVYADALSNFSVDFGFFLLTDLGDLPDTGAGIGAGNYRTLLRGPGDSGPAHVIVDGLRLGACVDAELDGQPLATAVGDDGSAGDAVSGACAVPGDDEDGIDVVDLNFVTGLAAVVNATVTNTTGNPGRVCGFADLNGDGDFDDVNERAFVDIGGNVTDLNVALNFGVLNGNPATYSLNVPNAPRYFRFRVADNQDDCLPDNDVVVPNGEVEDYLGSLSTPTDFGDLPAPLYPTLLADNGARHPLRDGLRIGACVDAEPNGQPNAAATGDDLGASSNTQGACAVAGDDEDGLTDAQLVFPVGANSTRAVPVLNATGSPAQLCGFVDWNSDGDFLDVVSGLSETVSVAVPDGTNGTVNLDFGTPPLGLPVGNRYLRLRLSTDAGPCLAGGQAADGEVEDYQIEVVALDFGDLPDTGPGVGPANYVTLRSSGLVAHDISSTAATLFLGALVDAEADGQPNLAASGDDDNGIPDDEDGLDPQDLIQVAGLPGIFRLTATNLTGTPANICGYVDWNGDGDFDDANEFATALVPDGSNDVVATLDFGLVPAGSKGERYARFRYTTASCADAGPEGGPIVDGEVEDYLITDRRADLGDLPDTGPGTGPGNYQTRVASNGPAHGIVEGLRMGACVDGELDGQPDAAALGDDSNDGVASGVCAVPGDDEDGVNVDDLNFIATLPATVRVTATNTTGETAFLCGFVDFNGDGDFLDSVGGVAEAAPQVTVPDGSVDQEFVIDFGITPITPVINSYARFRLSTTPGCQAFGAVNDGEVEDYAVTLTRRDFGDLPAPYPTLLADNGAYHDIVEGLFLGDLVDPEADGVPSVGADGDDLAGVPDDEDGVDTTDLADLHRGSPGLVRVRATNTTGSDAQVCGYIDFNRDGDFDDASEAAPPAIVPDGSNDATFTLDFGPVPPTSPLGQTYARFRLQSAAQPCAVAGPASAGEVEDYVATILPGEMSLGNLVWEDGDNDGRVTPGEPGLPGIPVELFVDANDDGVPDGLAIATQPTDASGNYLFDELVPDTYIVCITAPPTYVSSSGTGRPYASVGPNEPASDPDDDDDNDDNGTAVAGDPTRICSLPVTLTFGGEPIDDGDADDNSNLTVDFGLLYNFDLALSKTLAAGQWTTVVIGQNVRYTITVRNEGTVAAQNIEVTDHLPPGFVLDDPDWTAGPGNTATRVIPGPLAPGEEISVGLVLRVDTLVGSFGERINFAEISRAEDPTGATPLDIDSNADDDPDNDPPEEDDSDTASVELIFPPPALIPGLSPWGLLLLVLIMGLLAGTALRRQSGGAARRG